MTTSHARSRGRPPVPLDRIVTTALEIVDAEGPDALSMRTLAQRLNSGTATLYRHFASRADLIAAVVDTMFGAIELDVGALSEMSWQDACKAVANNMFDVLRRHRNVAALLVADVPVGPNALAAREWMLAFLLDNDFPPALAARSYATLSRYILGFAMQLNSSHGEAPLTQIFHNLDPSHFPATVAVADSLPVPFDDEFSFGLDLIVDGLTQALQSAQNHGANVKRERRSAETTEVACAQHN